jgi:hypothetical protein
MDLHEDALLAGDWNEINVDGVQTINRNALHPVGIAFEVGVSMQVEQSMQATLTDFRKSATRSPIFIGS